VAFQPRRCAETASRGGGRVDPVSLAGGASAEGTSAVTNAVAVLSRLGYGDVIAQGVGLVVLLNRRVLGEETSSWTTVAFPGTVYLDWYAQPEFLAKDLVHEATHAWLNDALEARAVSLPPEELYYSPWKGRLRSAYGMIHSIIAFSRVTNLLTRLYYDCSDPAVRTYCTVRVGQETERLKGARDAAYGALAVIDDAELTNLIRAEYEEALGADNRLG
jgi:HEXXH motif-containing protein